MRRWLAGGQVSCSGPSTSTHCTASPGSLVLVGPDLVHGLGRRQPVGKDADGAPRLQMIDELDDGRLVGGGVEVADQVALRRHPHRAGVDAKGDRLAGALKAGGGDAEAILAAVRRIELRTVSTACQGDELKQHHRVVEVAKHALGGVL